MHVITFNILSLTKHSYYYMVIVSVFNESNNATYESPYIRTIFTQKFIFYLYDLVSFIYAFRLARFGKWYVRNK